MGWSTGVREGKYWRASRITASFTPLARCCGGDRGRLYITTPSSCRCSGNLQSRRRPELARCRSTTRRLRLPFLSLWSFCHTWFLTVCGSRSMLYCWSAFWLSCAGMVHVCTRLLEACFSWRRSRFFLSLTRSCRGRIQSCFWAFFVLPTRGCCAGGTSKLGYGWGSASSNSIWCCPSCSSFSFAAVGAQSWG